MKTRLVLTLLKEARDAATMRNAGFDSISGLDGPLPTSEKEVTDFIRERTRLYRDTWVISPIDRAIEEIEGKPTP